MGRTMRGVGECATLACLWEATAPKPGNVYRGADFEDLTYADFVTSAAVIGPIIEQAVEEGVGATILRAVQATQAAVATNTNLGMLLLIVPLAAVPKEKTLAEGIEQVLAELGPSETARVYKAINAASAGGLGKVEEADVAAVPPEIPLVAAMRLATERDMVARQYVNHFEQVFLAADKIERARQAAGAMSDAIVKSHLQLLAEFPDTLIARKCGNELAEEVTVRAQRVLQSEDFHLELAEFDFWLRADGHRRNPGTTADLIAAGLFVLLRENRLDWPIRFYQPETH